MKIRISPAGSKGFTLIELLVVLSLIGVFFFIGLINVGTLYERFIIKENALNVIRVINKARAFAMSRENTSGFEDKYRNQYYFNLFQKGRKN